MSVFNILSIEEFQTWITNQKFKRDINLIQNHHTLEPSYSDFNNHNHQKLLQNIEEFHIKERGFRQIAQNLTTFPDGKIAICRSLDMTPAGIKGANMGAICIEHLGNFDLNKDKMTDLQKTCIITLNAILCHRFKLQPNTNTIVYHHWFDLDTGKRTNGSGNVKTCPGTDFFGGNSVKSAETNFVPLVSQTLKNIKD